MRKLRLPWWLISVAVVTFIVFAPCLGAAFLNWDDGVLIVQNERIRSLSWTNLVWMFTTAYQGPYQPLAWLSWALDYQLWGLNPAGYHLGNNLFHALNAVIVFVLTRRIFLRMGLDEGRWLDASAAVAALFFAVHPLRVESVVWASQRRDVLAVTLALLSLVAWLHHVDPDRPRADWRWLALSSSLYFLALLSKATPVPLPAVLLVMDVYPLRRLQIGASRVRRALVLVLEKTPFIGMAAIAAGIALLGQKTASAMAPFEYYTPYKRIVQAFYGLAFYVCKTLLPVRLAPLYPIDHSISLARPVYLACALAVVAATALLFAFRKRVPGLVAASLCYVVMIAPLLGFLQIGAAIAADRYTYLATLPFAPVVGWTVYRAGRRWPAQHRAIVAMAVVVLAVFAGQSIRYMGRWSDSLTLWTYTAKREPSSVAFVNLGNAWYKTGQLELALAATDRAAHISPAGGVLRNRGLILAALGRYEEARADFDRAIQVQPDFTAALVDRGRTEQITGHADEALATYTEAIQREDCQIVALTNRGVIHVQRDELDAAIEDFSTAIECHPPNAGPFYNRAQTYTRAGRIEDAIADYTTAIHIEPTAVRAYLERSRLYVGQDRPYDALADLDRALLIRPQDPALLLERARAYRAADLSDAAARDLKSALQRAPEDSPLYREIRAQLQALGEAS